MSLTEHIYNKIKERAMDSIESAYKEREIGDQINLYCVGQAMACMRDNGWLFVEDDSNLSNMKADVILETRHAEFEEALKGEWFNYTGKKLLIKGIIANKKKIVRRIGDKEIIEERLIIDPVCKFKNIDGD